MHTNKTYLQPSDAHTSSLMISDTDDTASEDEVTFEQNSLKMRPLKSQGNNQSDNSNYSSNSRGSKSRELKA